MKAAVIGHPIAHSKSPIIHQYWMEQYGVQGTYEAIDITPENLKNDIQRLIDGGYEGFNVTLPHKQNIIQHCHEIDKTAQAIGAVNTVKIIDGKLYGTNTDAFGFIENLKSHVADFSFENKTALVLGAGGASRAIIYGLQQQNISKIIVSNRTIENAKILADDFDIEIIEWDKKETILPQTDLLVNTTSLGMAGKPPLEMDIATLKSDAVVSDIVYSPLMTDLLIGAKNKHNQYVTGIGMLIHQARPAFQAWTDILPEVTGELEALVLK